MVLPRLGQVDRDAARSGYRPAVSLPGRPRVSDTSPEVGSPAEVGRIDADVAVIGGSLAAALAAQRLAAAGLAVVVVLAEEETAPFPVLVLPPGLDGRIDVASAHAFARARSWVEASAPHLASPLRVSVALPTGISDLRAAIALDVLDALGLGPASMPDRVEVETRPGLVRSAIVLGGLAVDEARLALAALLWARRRDARVIHATVEHVAPRRVQLRGGGEVHAPVVVDARPARTSHVLHLRLPARGQPYVDRLDVAGRSVLVQHLVHDGASVFHLLDERPDCDAIPLGAALEALGLAHASPVRFWSRRQDAVERPSLRREGDVLRLEGRSLLGLEPVLERVVTETGAIVSRKLEPAVGRDARLEDPEAEWTPALFRAGLGSGLRATMERRHGSRAAAIVQRVLAVPREGALVCPCANVTLAELLHAQREELASSLPALVRRTDVGSGPCAGVRCGEAVRRLTGESLVALGRAQTVLGPAPRALVDELALGVAVALGDDEAALARRSQTSDHGRGGDR